ncbi:MAG: hypothetical protein ACM37Z_22435, partial [Deltaproteobacteria bacterium]
MKNFRRTASVFALLCGWILTTAKPVQSKTYVAYISDSMNSSVIYWIAKDAGIFKKHGLDLETIFLNGSV